MKRVTLKSLKDETKFKFNRRTKVVWEIQTWNKVKGRKYATITATVSGITKNKSVDTLVWI